MLNRRRLTLPSGDTVVDTGLVQTNRNFDPDPGMDGGFVGPFLIASRVMVQPMAPTANWANITHTEPTVNPATDHVEVTFSNGGDEVDINVLFWNPHTSICPVSADSYNPPD